MADSFDIAIIGGGIVGMATAKALLESRPRSLIVLEAERELAAHQTGRNSGVIHSGIYYKPGSLKATLCAAGREAMIRFCSDRGIRHERCGKVIVATEERELPALDELERRARANGLNQVRRCSPGQLREREPHIAGIAGLEVGETGIVRYATVLEEMGKLVAELGGRVRLGARVLDIAVRPRGFVLTTPQGELSCANIVNCAGAHCDSIARMCGLETGIQIIPFRGEYYDLLPHRRHLVKHLVYPVPDARYPFLGVHFTRATDNTVEAGPNAVLAFARDGYTRDIVSPEDLGRLLSFPGFWAMARRHWRMGIMEMRRSLSEASFVRALQKLVPEIRSEDVTPGRAGIRAQALDVNGNLLDDFRLAEGPGMLHVLNAPSPAATASLAIGKSLADAAGRVFR
jgi:(S)-2-hydroxyglutarate dehydrogenase